MTRTYMERKGSVPPAVPILTLIVQSELDFSLLKDTEVSHNVTSIEWNNLILDAQNMLGLRVSSSRSHDFRFYLTTDNNVTLPNDFGRAVQELSLLFQPKSTCFLETQLKLHGYMTAEWSSKEGGKGTDGKR